jgi:hypothetical protein
MAKVIILNGPPHSGKDHASKVITSEYKEYVEVRSSRFIKRAVHQAYGLNIPDEYFSAGSMKDTPQDAFFGRIPRDVYIEFSEAYMKRQYGQDIFGRIMGRHLVRLGHHVKFSIIGMGFVEEVQAVVKHFLPENCLIMQLESPGMDWQNDSRSYITLSGVHTIRVHNDRTPTFDAEIISIVREFNQVPIVRRKA